MKREAVQDRILEMLEQVTGNPYTLDQDLMEDGSLSSLELMNLIVGVEQEFRVKIPSRKLRFVATAADLVDLICERGE
ncbi:MAG: hypothetical protein HFE83_08030 [Lachnospiraceae bacterium]|nr:hypothetical protein [Lachnospiraceae bacterium]